MLRARLAVAEDTPLVGAPNATGLGARGRRGAASALCTPLPERTVQVGISNGETRHENESMCNIRPCQQNLLRFRIPFHSQKTGKVAKGHRPLNTHVHDVFKVPAARAPAQIVARPQPSVTARRLALSSSACRRSLREAGQPCGIRAVPRRHLRAQELLLPRQGHVHRASKYQDLELNHTGRGQI